MLRSAEDYPANFTMIEIIRNLRAAPPPPPSLDPTSPPEAPATPTPSPLPGALAPPHSDTYAQDHLLAEYLQASWNSGTIAPGPNTVDIFGLDNTVDVSATAEQVARVHPDPPPLPPLLFTNVVPPSGRMSASVWEVLQGHYKLPAAAVVGAPTDWGPLGHDGAGTPAHRGAIPPPPHHPCTTSITHACKPSPPVQRCGHPQRDHCKHAQCLRFTAALPLTVYGDGRLHMYPNSPLALHELCMSFA